MLEIFNAHPYLALPTTVLASSLSIYVVVKVCKGLYNFNEWLKG